MDSRFITGPIIQLVHELNKAFSGDIVFCGSFGLVFNGVLDREIGDIDALVFHDYYHGGLDNNVFERHANSSDIFEVNGHKISCFSMSHPEIKGIDADILHMPDGHVPPHDIVDFHGVSIKIEKPEGAFVAKKQYTAQPKLHNKEKHNRDIDKMSDFFSPENIDDLPF